jgi:hypothetical protein
MSFASLEQQVLTNDWYFGLAGKKQINYASANFPVLLSSTMAGRKEGFIYSRIPL